MSTFNVGDEVRLIHTHTEYLPIKRIKGIYNFLSDGRSYIDSELEKKPVPINVYVLLDDRKEAVISVHLTAMDAELNHIQLQGVMSTSIRSATLTLTK